MRHGQHGCRTQNVGQDARVLARIDGKAVFGIVNAKLPRGRLVGQHKFSSREQGAIMVTQYCHQHLVCQIRIGRMPVDIEEVRVDRGRPVLQHIEPPSVVRAHDPHVVRHHVQDLPHPMPVQTRDERIEFFTCADFGI